MKSLIFGSAAAKHWFPEWREPKDLDILTQEEFMSKDRQHYWYGASSQWILDHNKDPEYVDADLLYTIKAAHFNWDIFWDKTAYDIVQFQKLGLQVNKELYKLLVKDFTEFHGKRWASLKGKNATTFFEDAVHRVYVHDSIHDAVAYYDEPLYHRILKSPDSVACSEEKFNQLSLDDQLKLVREEIFVTALERWLVPTNFQVPKQLAYQRSLKKLVTTMSSGWFSLFIIENFSKLTRHEDDYVARFNANSHKLKYDNNTRTSKRMAS